MNFLRTTNGNISYSWGMILFLYLLLRFQNIPGVFSDAGFSVTDTDPYYRLHRIESIVQGSSWTYPLKDPSLNYPDSWEVAWPIGMDSIIAAPLKIFGVHQRIYIQMFAALMIPILMLPIVFFSGGAASIIAGTETAFMVCLFLVFMKTLVFQTSVGRIDHHGFEALFAILGFWFLLKMKKNSTRFLEWSFAICLGLAPAIFPHGWFFSVLICFALIIEKNENFLKTMSKIFLCAFIISLIPLMCSARFFDLYISTAGFSWWGSVVLLGSSLFVFFLLNLRFSKNLRTKSGLFILGCVVTGILAAIKYGLIHSIYGQVARVLEWLMTKGGTLTETRESWSPFRYSFKELQDIVLIFLMPIIFGWFLIRKKYAELMMYSLLPITLTFIQIRFMVVASPFIALSLVLFLKDLTEFLKINLKVQKISIFTVLFLITFMYKPVLGFTHRSTNDYYYFPVRAASTFLLGENERKNKEKMPAVLAHWDYGFWILYYSKLPVVAHPFQGASAMEVEKLFGSTDRKVFEKYKDQYRFQYLMVEDSVQRERRMIEMAGLKLDDYIKLSEVTDTSANFQLTSRYTDLFPQQWLKNLGSDEKGNFPSHWRLVYVSPFDSLDYKNKSALKVFEQVHGVTIEMKSDKKELYLLVEILEKDKQVKHILRQESNRIGNKHQWVVPYSSYDRGGVFCNGVFQVVDSSGKMIRQTKVVKENSVLNGSTVVME